MMFEENGEKKFCMDLLIKLRMGRTGLGSDWRKPAQDLIT